MLAILIPPVFPQTVVFSEGFESDSLAGWKTSGIVWISSERPHTGKYSVMLGGGPLSYAHGPFSLNHTASVTSGSNFTVSLWYCAWNAWPFGEGGGDVGFPDIRFTAAILAENRTLATRTLDPQRDLSDISWRNLTLSTIVPATIQTLTVSFTGKGGWVTIQGVGVIDVDDIVATETVPPQSTTTTSTTSVVNLTFSSISSVGQPMVMAQVPFSMYGLVGGLIVIVLVASVGVVARKRRTTSSTAVMEPQVTSGMTEAIAHPKTASEPSISTGHQQLDDMLAGGLPEGHAVLIVSPSYDERDLLVRKMIEANLAAGRPTFYLSNDIVRTRDFTTRFAQNFYAMNPLADRITSERGNLFKIPDVSDLSGLSITSNQIIESKLKNEPSKLIVIDLLSDILLRYKALTTRKWLSDFLSKREAGGFTVLATLDPSIAQKEDIQTIVGVFDGVIEIYERQLQERSRRFLVIKKMYGRDYSESELMLDKQQLL